MTMSPMDELAYFRTPIHTSTTVTANTATKILLPDPMRIAVIFSTNLGAGLMQIAPGGSATPPAFSLFISNTGPFQILHAECPGLPQMEWWAMGGGAPPNKITTIEMILTRWPKSDPYADIGRMAKLLQYLGLRKINGSALQWPSRTTP